MQRPHNHALPLALAAIAIAWHSAGVAHAERFNDTLGPANSNWSNQFNWVGQAIADNNTEVAELAIGDPVVDADFTVRELRTLFSTTAALLSGPGTLTIDRNSSTTALGLFNGSGQGAVLEFDGNLTINNSNGNPARTVTRNGNNNSNVIRFNPTSTLSLQTGLETQNGVGGSIEFNGALAGPADLFFNSNNATFGATADNTGYEGDLVFFSNALAVSDLVGGTLIGSDGKVQVNGNGSRIEINGAETFLGDVVVDGTNAFTFDADADQSNMGVVEIANGSLTIDIDAAVNELAFEDTSEIAWGAGSLSIVGFKEDTIRFGTDAGGLTEAQLAAIDGGIYSLSSQGYLTAMAAPTLPGDFNDDGAVDAADYTVWRDALNGTDALPNDDGLGTPIGSAHYNLWSNNFGSVASSAAAVPEPSTVALAILGLGATCCRRSGLFLRAHRGVGGAL